jgi:hypothetical protein
MATGTGGPTSIRTWWSRSSSDGGRFQSMVIIEPSTKIWVASTTR